MTTELHDRYPTEEELDAAVLHTRLWLGLESPDVREYIGMLAETMPRRTAILKFGSHFRNDPDQRNDVQDWHYHRRSFGVDLSDYPDYNDKVDILLQMYPTLIVDDVAFGMLVKHDERLLRVPNELTTGQVTAAMVGLDGWSRYLTAKKAIQVHQRYPIFYWYDVLDAHQEGPEGRDFASVYNELEPRWKVRGDE